jgi:ATP-binding cassette subfamily C protein CydC
VLLNNTSLNEVSAEWLNSQVGLIEQNPTIFRGTVRQNLLLANPDSLDSDLEKVLRDVRLWAMLKEREGLDTQVGDRGLLLSGGEAQRLALARAMLSNFKLLILDEPTANVDQESASVLVKDLLSAANLQGKRMVILITHDPDIAALVQRKIEVS